MSPLSPAETVERFLRLYRAAGPQVGCCFVDPASMLTLSGVRGMSDWHGPPVDASLLPPGIRVMERSLVNLAGAAWTSRRTQIAGILRFDESTGWPGYRAWREAAYDSVATGVLLGYPDRAIVGYLGLPRETANDRCIFGNAAYSTYYECAAPHFDFLPQDVDDPGIQRTLGEWSALLRGIYRCPDMVALDTDPAFRAARRTHLLQHDDHSAGWWSQERGRLGIWDTEKSANFKETWDEQLSDRHERVAVVCGEELCRGLRAGEDLDEMLARCRSVADRFELECRINLTVLKGWIRLGVHETDGLHRRLLEAARQGHAELIDEPKPP